MARNSFKQSSSGDSTGSIALPKDAICMKTYFDSEFAVKLPKRGERIWGWVESENKHGFWIHYQGCKSEALAEKSEIKNQKLQPGDHALFHVLSDADETSCVKVCLDDGEKWQGLVAAKQDSKTLKVKVSGVHLIENRVSRLIVNCDGITGILPVSLLAMANSQAELLLDKEIEVKVHAVNFETGRLVFNSRKVLNEYRLQQEMRRENLIASLQPGMVLKQVAIHSIFKSPSGSEQGILVQLEGARGLVHRKEIPSRFLRGTLSQQFQAGDLIDVMVLPLRERENGRKEIALSIMAVEHRKKQEFLDALKEGDIVDGTIERQAIYGFFANVSKDARVDGLLHNNELPAGVSPQLGSEVVLRIISIDRKKCTLGLSMRGTELPELRN